MQGSIFGVRVFVLCVFSLLLLGPVWGQVTPGGALPATFAWSVDSHQSHSGDFNGDGYTDLLLQPRAAGVPAAIVFSFDETGERFADYVIEPGALGVAWSVAESQLLIADVSGDGFDDIIALGSDKKKVRVLRSQTQRARRNPDKAFKLKRHQSFKLEDLRRGRRLADYQAHLGDFNGDGRVDLLLQGRDTTAPALLLTSDDEGQFASEGVRNQSLSVPLAADQALLSVGDFNGDGVDDVLSRSPNATGDHALTLMGNTPRVKTFNDGAWDATWHGAVSEVFITDFNADGLSDIAVHTQDILDASLAEPQLLIQTLINRGPDAEGWPRFEPCRLERESGSETRSQLPLCDPEPLDRGPVAGKAATAKFFSELTATPNPCDIPNGGTVCTSRLFARQVPQRYACIYHRFTRQEIACGWKITHFYPSITAAGIPFKYTAYDSPSAQTLQTLFVSGIEEGVPAPSNPGVPDFTAVEITHRNPVVDTNGSFNLCWAKASNAPTHYEWLPRIDGVWGIVPQRVVAEGGTGDQCLAQTITQHATDYQDYVYRVRATNTGGDSAWVESPIIMVAPMQAPPITTLRQHDVEEYVSGLGRVDHNGQFRLSWSVAQGSIDGYRWRRRIDNGAWTAWTNATTPHLNQNLALNGYRRRVEYQVGACIDLSTCGVPQSPANTSLYLREGSPPSAPGTITFGQLSSPVADNDDYFTVAWSPSTGTVDHYRVEIWEGPTKLVGPFISYSLSLPDPQINYQTDTERTLRYEVYAWNWMGFGPRTIRNIVIQPTRPPVPLVDAVAWADYDARLLRFDWTPRTPNNATYFQVQEGGPGSQYHTFNGGATTSGIVDKSTGPWGTYGFYVWACNSGGCTRSNPTGNLFIPDPAPPPPASSVAASFVPGREDDLRFSVDWTHTNTSNVASYRVGWTHPSLIDPQVEVEDIISFSGATTTHWLHTPANQPYGDYRFRVWACNYDDVCSAPTALTTLEQPVPAPPSSVRVVAGASIHHPRVTWVASPGLNTTYYQVYETLAGVPGVFATTEPLYEGYDLTGRTGFVTFEARACNSDGECSTSGNPFKSWELITPPTGLHVTWLDNTGETSLEFVARWDSSGLSGGQTYRLRQMFPDATGRILCDATDHPVGLKVQPVDGGTFGTGRNCGVHQFQVAMCNTQECSIESQNACTEFVPVPDVDWEIPCLEAPSVPTGLNGAWVDHSTYRYQIAWDAATGLDGTRNWYEVTETAPNNVVTVLPDVDDPATLIERQASASALGDYTYTVKACKEITGQTLCSDPSAPFAWTVTEYIPPFAAPNATTLADFPGGQIPPSGSDGIGATPAGFAVSNQGAATYSIPILTAPATGGLAPAISLNYNSNQGDGPLGIGWSISGPSMISRCSQDFIHEGQAKALSMDDQDRLCLNGQRLFLVNGAASYWDAAAEYRTEVDNLIKVSWHTGQDYLIARFPDGSHATFGRTDDAKVYGYSGTPPDPANPLNLLNWAQDTHQDASGNFIHYEYVHFGNTQPVNERWTEFHLSQVSYTGHDENGDYDGKDAGEHKPYAEIVFNYETVDRTDPTSRWLAGGSELRQTRRISSIESKNNNITLRQYNINYGTDGVGRSIVESIQECRLTTCFGMTDFTWGKSAGEIGSSAQNPLTPIDLDPSQTGDTLVEFLRATDINQDGYQDLVYTTNNNILRLALGGSAGLTVQSASTNAPPSRELELADFTGDGIQDVVLDSRGLKWSQGQWVLVDNVRPAMPPNSNDMVVGDIDGDGYGDLFFESQDALYVSRHLGKRDASPAYASPLVITTPQSAGLGPEWNLEFRHLGTHGDRIEVGDYNGDGLIDLWIELHEKYRNQNLVQEHRSWWLLVGLGDGSFAPAEPLAYGGDCDFDCDLPLPTIKAAHFLDINNDSLTDWLYQQAVSSPNLGDNEWHYQLNSGGDFVGVGTLMGEIAADTPLYFADIDGNGFVDVLYPFGSAWKVFYWRHDGFEAEVLLSLSAGNQQSSGLFFDINGDGRTDYLLAERDPDTATVSAAYTLATNAAGSDTGPLNVITQITDGLGRVTKIDYAPLSDPEVYQASFNAVDVCANTPNTRPGPGLPSRQDHCQAAAVYPVTGSRHVVQQVTAQGSPNQVLQYRYDNLRVQGGGRGSLGFRRIWRYQPQVVDGLLDITFYHQDSPFIGLAEFRRLRVLPISDWTANLGNTTRISSQTIEWAAHTTAGDVQRPYPKVHLHIDYNPDQAGNPDLRHIRTAIDSVDAYGYPTSVTTTTTRVDGPSSTTVLSQQTGYTYYGDNVADPNNSTDRIAAWQLGLVDELSLTAIRDGASCTAGAFIDENQPNCIARETEFIYNDRALLTQEIIEPNGGDLKLTSTYTLDKFGNRSAVSVQGSGDSRSVSVNYDIKGRYVIRQKNADNQAVAEVLTRDAYGNPTQVRDYYQATTHLGYDLMGRAYFSLSPEGAWQHSSLSLGNNPPAVNLITDGSPERNRLTADVACPTGTTYYSLSQGGGIPESWQCFDAQGRLLRGINTAFDGRLTYSDISYDELGRVVSVSEPHYRNIDAGAGEPSQANHASTLTTYDTLSRTTDHSNWANETVSVGYAGLDTTLTQPGGVVRKETRNVLGELVTLVEDQGSATPHINATTRYSYDAVGALIQVTDPDNAPRNMRYNVRGMRTKLDDPDLRGLGQSWAYQFVHNAFGEVTRQWHPGAKEAIEFDYDHWGRLTHRRDLTSAMRLEGGEPDSGNVVNGATWTYEGGSGLLKGEELDDMGVKRSFHHDGLGRLERLTTAIDLDGFGGLSAESFSQRIEYDQYGRVFQSYDAAGTVLPNSGIRTAYNNYGYASESLEAARPGGLDVSYAAIQSVDARGNLKTLDYGNGLRASYGYDAQSRLTDIAIPGIQHLSYQYDDRGNLTQREDILAGASGLTETFAYDGLNRLNSISLNSSLHAGYRYSNGGKLECAGSYTNCGPGGTATSHHYGQLGAPPNALTTFDSQVGEDVGVIYGYDAKGNQTSKSDSLGNRTIEYAVFNKPTRIVHATDLSETRYAYGPNRQRYLREDINGGSITRTYYIGNVEVRSQHLNGQEQYRQYRRDLGTAIQTIEQNGSTNTQYVHRDHLGSIDVLTTEAGIVSEKFSYDAFGRRRDPNDWSLNSPKLFNGVSGATANATLRGFTDHEHIAGPDPKLGLIHMNGRTYDPQTGRFMQADPFVPNPGLGQSYNRYSYVFNNPLTLTDPSGFNPFEDPFPVNPANDDGFNLSPDPLFSPIEVPEFGHFNPPAQTLPITSTSHALGRPNSGTVAQAGELAAATGGIEAVGFEFNVADAFAQYAPIAIEAYINLSIQSTLAQGRGLPDDETLRRHGLSEREIRFLRTGELPYVPPSLPQGVVDFSAGAGDSALLGFGGALRSAVGVDGGVDTNSTAYFGGSVSGLVVSGGAVGVKVVTTVARNRASRAVAKSVDPNTLARTHSIEGKRSSKLVDRISDSMHKDGFIGEPIDVVQHKGKNFIIDGHHRAAAARRTGTQVDINVVDDIAGHRSNFNSLDDVLKSAETVGSNRLRPPRR